ncbi:carboxypeptidase-like regulatory domain-containing protein [Corallibacter sp.]|uniref:carboxypeptidase-like regulatory domain-containing protein n=1 Tax=Corallibacter sp. TaxID=2038084 RepID=UPI003AB85D97
MAAFLKRLLIIVFSLYSFSTMAQTELKNKIVDFASFLPIENASVYIQNTTIGTVSNSDGKFVLSVPQEYQNDTLVVSSIGYKSFKTPVKDFDNSLEIILEEDVASLSEVLIVADNRPKTGNEIVLKAIEELPYNMPDSSYLQKGFLRHKERNKKEFKWLVESAITIYDSGFQSNSAKNLKVNVDQVRKSYDLRDVDSLLTYTSYLKNTSKISMRLSSKNLKRDTIKTTSLVKAIKWNDTRVNGLENLFKGKLNLLRNVQNTKALFGDDILERHQFKLDTVLIENDRKIYKIKIEEGKDFVNLDTKGIFNNGFKAEGWLYIYWDTFAVKKIEYELIAASDAQKSRSKTLFDTYVNHKLTISYMEYQDKMYPNYIYYETPKLVNVGYKPTGKEEDKAVKYDRDERYYYTVQEILFTEIIEDQDEVQKALSKTWDPDIFAIKPYNKEFWRNYNILLESEEEEKMIQDLTKRSSLFKG